LTDDKRQRLYVIGKPAKGYNQNQTEECPAQCTLETA
jgi:hypothetical protein